MESENINVYVMRSINYKQHNLELNSNIILTHYYLRISDLYSIFMSLKYIKFNFYF